MSLLPHLELIDLLQFLQVRDKSRSVLQRAQKLHLKLQHLRKVPEQHVQLKHAPQACFYNANVPRTNSIHFTHTCL